MKIPVGRFVEGVLARIKVHAQIAAESIDILKELVSSFDNLEYDHLKNLYEKLVDVEKKGDELKRELIGELKTGYLHPEDREDFLRAILILDEIPGLVKAVSKKILIFKHIGIPIPPSIQKYLVGIAENSKRCVESLVHLVEHYPHDSQKVIEYASEAEKYEETVDDLRLDALEELFKLCRENLGIHCVALHVMIDDSETITDKCEDVADVFRLSIVAR